MTTTSAPALTPKQQQVLDLLKKGKKPGEIAKRLKISPSGVNGHIRNMRAAGVEIPTNGRSTTAAAPTPPPPAAVTEPLGSGALSPEEAIRAAIAAAENRTSEIEAEVQQLQARIEGLGEERTALDGRRERLSSAYGQLA